MCTCSMLALLVGRTSSHLHALRLAAAAERWRASIQVKERAQHGLAVITRNFRLGGYKREKKAARARDRAAVLLTGQATNHPTMDYPNELADFEGHVLMCSYCLS